MFLQFLLQIILLSFISLIFLVIIIYIVGLLEWFLLFLLVLRKYVFKCLFVVLMILIMMKLLFILFFLFVLLWLELVTYSLDWVMLSFILPIWILYVICFFIHVQHLRLVICNLLLKSPFFLLFFLLFIELFLILLFTLSICSFFFRLLDGFFYQSHKKLYNIKDAFLMSIDDVCSFYLQKIFLDDIILSQKDEHSVNSCLLWMYLLQFFKAFAEIRKNDLQDL